MKLALILSLFSFSAFANWSTCTQYEAQFIGKYVNVQTTRIDQVLFECSYQLDFTRYDISMVCPLDMSEARQAFLTIDEECPMKEGDFASGILVQKNGYYFID